MQYLHILDLPMGTTLELVQVCHGREIPLGYEPAAWFASHHDRHIRGAAARVIHLETTDDRWPDR